jgi:hypothetical protein
MIDKVFLIEHNNKVIGVYGCYEDAELFIQSCLQNKLMNSAKILSYRFNSCLMLDSIMLDSNELSNKTADFKPTSFKLNSLKPAPTPASTPIKLSQEQQMDYDHKKKESIKLQHQINMLKVYKQKVEESKQVYENDLKLFNLFNNELNTNEKFVIPELFVEKYKLFKKLQNDNNLSWETFVKECKVVNYYDDEFKLNSYEEKFLNYESDSDTEDSKDDNILEELYI